MVFHDVTERRRAENALRASEERLRRFYESGLVGVMYWNMDGAIIDANDKFLEMVGYTREELSAGKIDWLGMTPAEYRHLDNCSVAELKAMGVNKEPFEKEYIRKDGTRIPVIIAGAMLDEARFNGVAFVLNITERKQAHEALRESEEHYRSLFDNMLNGFAYCKMIFDETGPKDFTYLNVNAAFVALTGLKDVIGKNVSEVIPGIRQSDPELFEIYGRVALTGTPERFETYVEALGMWFSISVYSPRKEYFVAVFDVITERKRAEEALQRSHEELEKRVLERTEALRRQADLLELAYNAIMVRDLSGKITFWNTRAEELYGFTRDEALGQVIYTLLQTRFPVPFEEHMAALTTQGRWEGELTHTTKDGRQLVILSRQALQRDESGRPVAILEINLDMTEQRRVEGQLRQAQKMEALGTMSGGIAHDFNNILAAIIGFTELLEGHTSKGSRDARHLARIMEAGIRGRELVRQMLAFSRKSEQEKKPLRMSSIVDETVKFFRATTPATINIRVKTVNESDLILGDPTQLQQVLMNLYTNASYAMREKGGNLDIELSDYSASQANDDPDGVKPGLYVKLSVSDAGTGMSGDVMTKIFDPFFTTKMFGEGSGLGLSVVHGIVSQHGGYITVESQPDKGSTFTIYLPSATGEPETAEVSDDETPTGSERILFVDDEEALVEMGEDILAELGYEVTSRMNSREALALLKSDPSRFDLVITDQTMPEMTGIELAKEILAIRANMPIIMCTGFSYVVDADKAMAAGIKAFAMKPLTKREIAKTIRKVLDE
jgi:PAS domain S-box-containing protein